MTCPDPLIDSDPSALYHLYNEKQGFLPAPVQNDQPSKISKKKKNLFKKFLLVILVLLAYLFYKFLLPLYSGWPFYHRDHHHDHVIGGDTCSNDGALLLRGDHCSANAIPWNGPSIFSTASDRFLLTFSKGNMAAKVTVKTSAHVLEPTLKIAGYVSPVDDDDDDEDGTEPVVVIKNNGETKTDIEHQGVVVQITEDDYAYDIQIQYQDRVLRTPSGDKYCACARFEFLVMLPESYTQYSQMFIRGATAEIEVFDVDDIRFGELWFEVGEGNVLVQPATKGAPLAVVAETATGDVTLHARTKPADLNIHATTVEGSVRALVELESRAQTLRLDASSSTDSASALLSDDFSGRFRVESQLEANVYEAEESESKITYEKQTSLVKEGVKSFARETPLEGHVNLKSSFGLVVLEFTN
ncbi:hypothetical protein BG000_000140 [Podila horticola]|nr:hypothetical protein BG000_000140 [Podila horticola]